MNSIVYVSNAYSSQFPNNTDTAFTCQIDEKKLDYISKSPISVAVKSITLSLGSDYDTSNIIFGIKSNFSWDFTAKSSRFSDVVATFSVSDVNPNLISIFFENPIFFPTSVSLLQNATFSIIDITTNQIVKSPNEAEFVKKVKEEEVWLSTVRKDPLRRKKGFHTIITCCVKPDNITMKQPIKMMLESNDEESKKMFPNNDPMNYTVQLPQRYNFENEN